MRHLFVAVVAVSAGCSAPGLPNDPDSPTLGGFTAGISGALRLTVADVGQGDAVVVVAPGGCAAMIDGGPTGSGASLKAYLRSLGVTALDFAVASHYHADHIGALDEIDQGSDAVPIAVVYDRGGSYTSATYTEYANRFAGRRQTVTLGQVLSLCGEVQLVVRAVNGNGTSTTDENALSVAVKLSWGAFDALIGGDLTGSSPDIESLMASSVGEVEVYKVHHHGSRYSSNPTLLDALRPTVSLISVGANNSYGHPHPETVARLSDIGSAIWQTEDPATATALGHLELTSSSGTSYTIAQGTASVSYSSKGGDTTPPTAPAALTATAVSSSQVDLAWGASSDDVAVTGYRVLRDGALRTTVTNTAYSDTGLAPDATHSYTVVAVDAAGNQSPPSNPASATTFCGTTITTRTWSSSKKQLTVRATCTRSPTARLTAYAGATLLGTMTWKSSKGYYELVKTLAARPPCVTVNTDCGGAATSCF